jgi:hypothetical protein
VAAGIRQNLRSLDVDAQVVEPCSELSGVGEHLGQRTFIADADGIALVEESNDVRFKESRIPLFGKGVADRFYGNGDYGSAHSSLRLISRRPAVRGAPLAPIVFPASVEG